jgi:hypothetical protein
MKRLMLHLSVLVLALSGAGCQLLFTPYIDTTPEPETDFGSLVVNIATVGVKTLLPPIDMEPASYTITGSGPAGMSFQENTVAGQVTISELALGSWTITVEALNADGTIVGRGQGTIAVEAGKTVSLQVSVMPLTGFGSLQLTVNWTAADTQSPAVTGRLLPSSGTAIDLSFTIQSPGTAVCSKANIGTGYYTLTVELRDGGVLAMGAVEIARIVKDQTTSGVFDFSQLNPVGGIITVNIVPALENPISVSLSGQKAVLESGAVMTVAANVPAGTGNVACVWYLNGVSKATGVSFTVGAGLAAGVYRLDVAVFSADGKRGGSASHQFRVNAPALPVQATLEWDPNDEPDLAGYKIHWGLASGSYTNVVDVGNQTSYTLTGLTAGTTYYISATAYNTSGMQSIYSNEVIFSGSP